MITLLRKKLTRAANHPYAEMVVSMTSAIVGAVIGIWVYCCYISPYVP
jgi:hypothetical protein